MIWKPPADQTGDGRTSLNDKYGYWWINYISVVKLVNTCKFLINKHNLFLIDITFNYIEYLLQYYSQFTLRRNFDTN